MTAGGEVGLTRDAGWEIGVSKTLDHPIEQVWDFITSPEGTALWLGQGSELQNQKGGPYETADGTVGETRSFHPRERIRLTWRPETWDHDSVVQVTVSPSGSGRTILRFHQERLASADERSQQRDHWRVVMGSVIEALDASEDASE